MKGRNDNRRKGRRKIGRERKPRKDRRRGKKIGIIIKRKKREGGRKEGSPDKNAGRKKEGSKEIVRRRDKEGGKDG